MYAPSPVPLVGVQPSAEFDRIAALSWRDWRSEIERDELHLKMSAYYKTPWGSQSLRPIQAAALAELHDLRGFVGGLLAGEGKTLVSFLASTVLNAERPLLLIPAALREKTDRDFKLLSHHWLGKRAFKIDDYDDYHPSLAKYNGILVESYEMLSQSDGDKIFDRYNPDLVIADEAQKLKNMQAACTRRFIRHMRAKQNTIFVPMSGTIMVRSLHNFWHLMLFALRHHMPLPRVHAELERWAAAIDEKKDFSPNRPHAGVLFEFADEQCKEELRQMVHYAGGNTAVLNSPEAIAIGRKALRNRLSSAPGVIFSTNNSVEASLRIARLSWPPGEKMQKLLRNLRETGETPNGDILLDDRTQGPSGTAVWRQARELGCGFFYRWDPPAPEEWMKRRKKFFKKARQILSWGRPGIDSLGQVEQALAAGRINDEEILTAYREWVAIRDSYKIKTVAEWVDDTTLNRTLAWMRKYPNGMVWVEHRAFGFKLSELTGVGFCADDGCDQRGVLIDDYQGRQVIASVRSNGEGRNLQAWNRSLVVSATPNGGVWEQLLARTHRPGQLEDEVFYDVAETCFEQVEGFDQALRDARCIEDSTGMKQRLLYADHVGRE